MIVSFRSDSSDTTLSTAVFRLRAGCSAEPAKKASLLAWLPALIMGGGHGVKLNVPGQVWQGIYAQAIVYAELLKRGADHSRFPFNVQWQAGGTFNSEVFFAR